MDKGRAGARRGPRTPGTAGPACRAERQPGVAGLPREAPDSAQGRQKVRGLIGLMMRAGQLALGESGALLTVRRGEAVAVLLDEAASANTRKRFTDACAHRTLPCYLLPAELLAQATGKPGRKVAAMKTGSLAEQLRNALSPDYG